METATFEPLPEHPPLPALVRGKTAPHLVLLHGYGLLPRTYAWTADLLAVEDCVVVPHWLDVQGAWTYEKALAGVVATLHDIGVERATVIGHSFGGAIALGLAARRPDLVESLVISDSLALGPRWRLARSVLTGLPFIRLATYRAAIDFFSSWRRHSSDLTRAGWWAWQHAIEPEAEAVSSHEDMRRYVLWAERDTLLDRRDGQEFARMIGAEFHVVEPPEEGGPVDHDWVYRHPLLFVSMLQRLGLPTPLTDQVVEELTEDAVIHGTPGA